MSGTKPPVIHRVSALDLAVEAWTWPFAETRRAEIDAHFADKQREKPAMWNGRVLLGRNPVFSGDRFSASYFETDFASFLAWRDWGFPDESVFNGFGMGALRCAERNAELERGVRLVIDHLVLDPGPRDVRCLAPRALAAPVSTGG